jgi:hypothetical protein
MQPLAPLRLGVLVSLISLGFAGIVGLIAVFDADAALIGVGLGVGTAWIIVVAGATMAAGLACLVRRRAELFALLGVAAAAIAVDLASLAFWRDIQNEAYGKVTAIAFVWSFFALVVLGLTLSVGRLTGTARLIYLGATAAAGVAGVVSTWLVATAGNVLNGPSELIDNDSLLRALGAALVVLAALWFSALAASRSERPQASEG